MYFLIRQGQIVYVGSSEAPADRVGFHGSCSHKDFDSVAYLPVSQDDRLTIERYWIVTLCPCHNKTHNPRPDDSVPGWGIPSGVVLKLPPEYRDALKAAWELTGRDMTVSGQIALEIYFQLLGVPFTPNWPAIVKELLDDGTS